MSHPVIRVSGLGKEYVIGGREKGNETFREMVTSSLAAPFRRWRKLGGEAAAEERFWALKDVSFEVRRGEVVGIIGRNGAGKSTLLKILSRITDPTEGEVEIRGRVASLLEVGTGFHPELTGRENIYLNGAILGMSRAEIDRKFDEIVAFAEVEKFLDTPVKRYSSGMYVRLAFAVAAHLEPEILIVDEVLAVGDAAFQKKCLGKMNSVSSEGRTVFFVSHNMPSVQNLCTKGILLNTGRIELVSEIDLVIKTYLSSIAKRECCKLSERKDRTGTGKATFCSLDIIGSSGCVIACGDKLTCLIKIVCQNRVINPVLYIGIFDQNDNEIVHINSKMTTMDFMEWEGIVTIQFCIPRFSLSPGTYRIDLGVLEGDEVADLVQGAGVLDVSDGDFFHSGYLGPATLGRVLIDHYWSLLDMKNISN